MLGKDNYVSPISVFLQQIKEGVREDTGQNDGVPAERYMRGDKLPWCMGIVLYCFDNSSLGPVYRDTKEYYHYRNVRNFEVSMQDRGFWLSRKVVPQPGDVALYSRRGESDPGRGRHGGLVHSLEWREDGVQTETAVGRLEYLYLKVLEGNVRVKDTETGEIVHTCAIMDRKFEGGSLPFTGFARPFGVSFDALMGAKQ